MANGQLNSQAPNLQLAKRTDSVSVSMSEWQVIREQASTLITTGFLPQSLKTPEQALAIILTGRELGIGPMASLGSINVIQGKPTVSPQLMLALINRTGEVENLAIETSDKGATCTIKRRGQTAYTATFGPKEAAAMGLSQKDNYKKQAATMFKWRAVADACRSTFADALLGLYTPDEMNATVDAETGEVIEAQPEPLRSPAFQKPEHQAAFDAQAPAPVEPPVADAEVLHMGVIESPVIEIPMIGKPDLLKIIKLTEKLSEYGVTEDDWRDRIEKITGQRSRKLIEQNDAGRVLIELSGALNAIIKEKGRR